MMMMLCFLSAVVGAGGGAGAGLEITSPSLSELTTEPLLDSLAAGAGAGTAWRNLQFVPFRQPAADAKNAQGPGLLFSPEAE